MLDSISVPRRSYDFEDYIDILRRNLRWLVAPAFAGLVIATVVAFLQQDIYISSALIRVSPQQISEKMGYSNFTSQDVSDRINSMTQTVLSRATLTAIINQYGLFKDDLKAMPMEDVVEKMRSGIGARMTEGVAAGGRTLPAMQVWYASHNRYEAQKICAELVSRFMSTSSQDMSDTQQAAYQFIKEERDQAKSDLDSSEQKVTDFRTKNAGHMPDEVSMNLQQLNSLGSQLAQYNQQLYQLQERRMMLDSQMSMARDRLLSVKNPDVVFHADEVNDLNNQIKQTELGIVQLKQRYTDDYPALDEARDRLVFLKKRRDEVMKQKVNSAETKFDPTTATADRMNAEHTIEGLKVQSKAYDMEERQLRRDIGGVNGAIADFRGRLSGVPAGEQAWVDIQRDYDLAKSRFLDAEGKLRFSEQAIRLDARKQGQTLELIDPASLPTTPAAPKRRQMLPVGLVAGIALGVVIVAVRELKDTSLKSLKDARLYTQLSILGSVPLLENDVVVQRRKQMAWISWAAATVVGLLIMAGSVAHYYKGRG